MSKSQFGSALEHLDNIGHHLLFVSAPKVGGYRLNSCVKSYNVTEKDILDTVDFDQKVTTLSIAAQEKPWFAVTTGPTVGLYKLIPETGKVQKMVEFDADFSTSEAKVNCIEFLYGNKYVITGGNDATVRVWKLKIDQKNDTVKSVEEYKAYKDHKSPIKHVSVTFDHELVASIGSGEEKECLVHDFITGNLLNELTFSEKAGQENMTFRGCIFSPSRRYLFTLASDEGKKSYVTRWDAKSEDFKNLNTVKVDDGYCPHFSLSSDGFYIAIGSETGFIKSLNTRYMDVDRDDQIHEGKMQSVTFTNDTRFVLTCDQEGTYCFVPNQRAEGFMRTFFQYLMLVFFGYFILRSLYDAFF